MSAERPMGILQRSDAMVQLLAERGPSSPAEIAEPVGTPRSSVYRLGDALREAGLVDQLPDGRLTLSVRWLRLSDVARAAMSEWAGARPILDELAATTRQTVFLSVPRGDESLCIDWARGEAINILLLKPGRSLPLYAGAAGRVTLAFGLGNAATYLDRAPFPAFTRRTLSAAASLRKDMATTRRQGYVLSVEDVTEGIGAVGAPLWGSASGRFAGALSLAGLSEEIVDRQGDLVDRLLAATKALSATLP